MRHEGQASSHRCKTASPRASLSLLQARRCVRPSALLQNSVSGCSSRLYATSTSRGAHLNLHIDRLQLRQRRRVLVLAFAPALNGCCSAFARATKHGACLAWLVLRQVRVPRIQAPARLELRSLQLREHSSQVMHLFFFQSSSFNHVQLRTNSMQPRFTQLESDVTPVAAATPWRRTRP